MKSLPKSETAAIPKMTKSDYLATVITRQARRTLMDLQLRAKEALKALSKRDYPLALGAFAGMEERIRKNNQRLQVLCEAAQKQTRKQ